MGLGHFYFLDIGEWQKVSDESRTGGEQFLTGLWGGETFWIINIFRILGNNGTRKKTFVQIR